MEVDEKPTEDYSDIGGLDKQIEELIEAVVLPMKQSDKFKNLGIKPPKGALMYGPPGTGRHCWLVPVLHSQVQLSSSWPLLNWCRCS